MARKTKEEAEKTYHELLAAAAELFTRRGVAMTTLDDIAKHVGVTRGAVYWHFKGKDEILLALMENYAIPKIRPVEEKLYKITKDGAVEQFIEVIDELLTLVIGDEKIGKAIRLAKHNVEHTENSSKLQAFMMEEAEKLHVAVMSAFRIIAEERRLKEGYDSDLAAQGFLCLFFGMMERHFHPLGLIDLSVGGKEMVRGYMFGVLKED